MSLPPDFNATGLLPPGDYRLTLDELRQSMLVTGPPRTNRRWDKAKRLQLVNNLEVMATQLWQVGIEDIFIDGSFVEDKASPNDIDGYFVCTVTEFLYGSVRQKLAAMDAVWTWDDATRTKARNSTKPQLPMWHKYHVELYPEFVQLSGIPGPNGENLPISAGFRQQRWTFLEKGIILLVREEG